MDVIIFMLLFIILLFAGIPIYASMIIPSIVWFLMNPSVTIFSVSQKLFVSLNNFSLLAVPLFILAGNIMNRGSVTERLFNFAKNCVGHWRGGLGYVNVVASTIFAGMSGSALADVGGLGQIEVKAMRDSGYDDAFTFGVTAASGTIGPIIPPSIPFAVFAAYAGVSTGALFLGGILPGLLMAVTLCIMVYVLAKKKNYPREKRVTLKELLKSFKSSFLALLMPLIIIGGIWTGRFTATEAACVSILYALVICVFVYKDFKIKDIPKLLISSAKGVVPVMMIVLAASLFCWIITFEKLDMVVLNYLLSLTQSKYVILLLIMLIVLILGCFFEGTVITMLLVPILLPICSTYGINIIHLGVSITLGKMIGLMTPPVGMSIFVMSSVFKISPNRIAKWCLPWMIPLFVTWLAITMWEPLVMLVPKLAGIGG